MPSLNNEVAMLVRRMNRGESAVVHILVGADRGLTRPDIQLYGEVW